MRRETRNTWAACTGMLAVALCTQAAANWIISFNLAGEDAFMAAVETAGAPGVNVANWNSLTNSGGVGLHTGSDDTLLMDDGTLAQKGGSNTGASWSWNGYAGPPAGGSGTDDDKMYSSHWDPFGSDPAATITVTNIPFDYYRVHVYFRDSGTTLAETGGDITVNGVIKALRNFQDGSFTQYIATTWSGPFDVGTPANVPYASYAVFDPCRGGTLTLTTQNRTAEDRFKISGFQIEEADPAPVISFNLAGEDAFMAATETAGAPGVNVDNWNSLTNSGGVGSHSGSDNTLLMDNGALAQNGGANTSVSWLWDGYADPNTGGSGTDDDKMYSSHWDPFGIDDPTVTISVTDLPFSYYRVHVYFRDSGLAIEPPPNTGGDVTVNGSIKALRNFNTGDFAQYVETTWSGPFDVGTPANVPRASYAVYDACKGNSLTLTTKDRVGDRFRVSGFQVEYVTPPPPAGTVIAIR